MPAQNVGGLDRRLRTAGGLGLLLAGLLLLAGVAVTDFGLEAGAGGFCVL